jgi:DNA-binding transcriptional regulator YiaG
MKPTVAERIKRRLEEFTNDLEDGVTIPDKYTCRNIEIDLKPMPYDPKAVKQTRKLLNASQAVFALFLGVCTKTVQAWEQGQTTPPKMACRFMDEIRYDPAYWVDRLGKAICVKQKHGSRSGRAT